MKKFELAQISDPYNCEIEDLEKEIQRLKKVKEEYHNTEQAVKVFINSCYGAMASPFFIGYNVHAAEAVTLQGQDLIKFANQIFDDYFLKEWHNDTETHKKMGITRVNPIQDETVIVYNDTDSVVKDTIINTSNGKKEIEKWFNEYSHYIVKEKINNKNDYKEVIYNPKEKILNWSEDKGLYYTGARRIIRHKTNKKKWKLKTKSGKEIFITNDHSIIIFRNNKKIEINPNEIQKGDKILSVKK